MIDVASFVDECYSKLPFKLQRRPWEATNHGRDVLKTGDKLNAYLAAYGEIHIIKCRAALQNFPFEDLKNYAFEIFDWGCGQGIATLTLLEMLRERHLLSLLKKITLIEPSKIALDRATSWVKQSVGPGISVISVNDFIPDSDEGNIENVTCSSDKSINLFSNILDIRTLSLSWLAHKVSSLARQNYIICVGPKYSGNTRIDDFCGYFAPKEFFSHIDTYPYAYTTKTHHAFGCETRCFVHEKSLSLNEKYREKANTSYTYADDYDYAAECMRGIIDDQTIDLFNKLRRECGLSFDVFLRPSINTDVPDIVLASSNKGIYVINICNEISQLREANNKVDAIKKNIYDLHLKSIKIDSVTSHRLFYVIKTCLFFPNNNKEEYEEELNSLIKDNEESEENNQNSYDIKKEFNSLIPLFPSDDIANIIEKNTSKSFKYEYYDELIKIIIGHWHSYSEGDLNIHLSDRQKAIVNSDNKRIRIKGVAGCGKTQVVANRAVEQQLKTGEKVLIITFNISLIQYIKMRINQVPADFCTNKFEITNYHQFFKSMAKMYIPSAQRRIPITAYDSTNYFEGYKKIITKYKSIIIDEVQDFKTEWLTTLIKYFLDDDGYMTVFGDGEQNIYDRIIEKDTKMPSIPTFQGRWNEMSDRISMRILNQDIANLSTKFAKCFLSEEANPILIQNEFQFEKFFIRYWNVGANVSSKTLASNILWIIQNFRIECKDTAVIGLSIRLLRDVEYEYRQMVKRKSMINFESSEEFIAVMRQNVDDKNKRRDLEDIRRAAKTHFTTDSPELKFSTIHSFKGWESKSIILVLQDEQNEQNEQELYSVKEHTNNAALIYTALTRAKCNIFILNLGNKKYDEFFKKNINMNKN